MKYSIAGHLAKEMKVKIETGEFPVPEDLAKFNQMLNRYGMKPIKQKAETPR